MSPSVFVRRIFSNEATVLPIEALPDAPPDAHHTWQVGAPAVAEILDCLAYSIPVGGEDAGRSIDDLREAHASIAHRLAVRSGYRGDLDIWALPVTALTLDYIAVPSRTAADRG